MMNDNLPTKEEAAAKLKVFVSTDFPGLHPVGTAAVVICPSEEAANRALYNMLIASRLIDLSEEWKPDHKYFSLREIPTDVSSINILRDGNY
jgi:hypothetical protein